MKKKIEEPKCPECEKLSAVSEKSQVLGCLLDWMQSQGIVLARWEKPSVPTYEFSQGVEFEIEDVLVQAHEFRGDSGINKLLAQYFEIDLDKVEAERRAILEYIQSKQD